MCGVVGLWSPQGTCAPLLQALSALQHRGQEGAGVLLEAGTQPRRIAGFGRIPQALAGVVREHHPLNCALGHLRYATSGVNGADALQPMIRLGSSRVDASGSIALVHNGNLTNLAALQRLLQAQVPLASDSDLLLQWLSEQLPLHQQVDTETFLDHAAKALCQVQGGFACIAWLPGQLLAFRDPFGIRPLQLGRRRHPLGEEWMLASESCAFTAAGFEFVRDIAPGELLLIDAQGALHSRQFATSSELAPSAFEYVYFAAASSHLDGISVASLRFDLGRRLALQLHASAVDFSGAVVVPVPSTSQPAAEALARALKLPYREWIRKKPGAGRSFILSDDAARARAVRSKFSISATDLKGRHILLVDDSIVRGTTLNFLVKQLRSFGVAKITLCCAAPPVRFSDCYGIDLPNPQELLASSRNETQMARVLEVDHLQFLPQAELMAALRAQNSSIKSFECALFDGKYVAGFQDKFQANRLLAAACEAKLEPEAILA